MPIFGAGKRLTIYIGESDSWRGRSLYMSILQVLRDNGIAGATVTRGLAGFGAHSRIRTNTIEVFSIDLPVIITIVDLPANIDRALSLVKPMVREGLVTIEDIEIVKYTHRYLNPLPAELLVSQIMTQDVVTVSPDMPVREVVELLLGRVFHAVPVVNASGQVVGIITTDDLLERAGMPTRFTISKRLDADDLQEFFSQLRGSKQAQEIMTPEVFTVYEDESVGHVVQAMLERGYKRLPVLNRSNQLVGMVSRVDVLRAMTGARGRSPEQALWLLPGQTLGEIMSKELPAVHAEDDLVDVLEQMLKSDLRWLIVLDDTHRAVGIITEGDVIARVSPVQRRSVFHALAARMLRTDVRRGQVTARQLMSENVLSAPGTMSVLEGISLMLQEGRKRIVVVDDEGYPQGIVDRQMLLAASLDITRSQ
jgi:CBS-domain-containing membrane protein